MQHETLLEVLKSKFGTTLEVVAVSNDEKRAFVLVHGEPQTGSTHIEQMRKIGQYDVEYHGFDSYEHDSVTFLEKCGKDAQFIFDKHWQGKSVRKPADPKFH